jgi:MFS family permease
MSSFLYMGAGHVLEGKRTWIYAVVGVAVPVAYLATVLSKVLGKDLARIAYVGPVLTAIGVGIGAGIVLTIVAAMASPKDAGRTDERDRESSRRGEYVGLYGMSIAAMVPLAVAMAKVEHVRIASPTGR